MPSLISGGLSRRGLLGGAVGLAGLGMAGGATASALTTASASASTTDDQVPFYGAHQAGIATPAQDRLAFAAFDLGSSSKADVVAMLKLWTSAAAAMTAGKALSDDQGHPLAPPVDTGEAAGLSPAHLTITVGVGPSVFDSRFGLADKRPAALADIPALPGDDLDPAISGGDLCVQACADDPVVAFHAVRNLARLARGTATMRWLQLGFGRTANTSAEQATPRNLMGFKDGTNNVLADDTTTLRDQVWVGAETDQAWMQGGSYVVSRRIRMLLETWDRQAISEQQRVFGRQRDTGAPLGEAKEHDPVDLAGHAIDPHAHIRLASPETNDGARLLRRGYSFTDGIDPETGELDSGLFFIAFQKDPRKQFVPIQTKLGQHDNLTEYVKHTSSGLFAVPPGVSGAGDFFASGLFA